ncbi:MAG: hypothetical protein K0T99_03715 [Alphaproteobacteria bacterium]|nr:hypothetical protein [Alphaproteobacteria bacterium]
MPDNDDNDDIDELAIIFGESCAVKPRDRAIAPVPQDEVLEPQNFGGQEFNGEDEEGTADVAGSDIEGYSDTSESEDEEDVDLVEAASFAAAQAAGAVISEKEEQAVTSSIVVGSIRTQRRNEDGFPSAKRQKLDSNQLESPDATSVSPAEQYGLDSSNANHFFPANFFDSINPGQADTTSAAAAAAHAAAAAAEEEPNAAAAAAQDAVAAIEITNDGGAGVLLLDLNGLQQQLQFEWFVG